MSSIIFDQVNKELEEISQQDLKSFYFDRRVDEYKTELNQFLDGDRLSPLRDTYHKIQERKQNLSTAESLPFLVNLYEIFIQETWKALGERNLDIKPNNR